MTRYRLKQQEIEVEVFNDGNEDHYVAQFPRTAVELPKNVLDALFCEASELPIEFNKDAYIDTLERYTAILEQNLREMNLSLKKIQKTMCPPVRRVNIE